jgi:hypothetical protein
VSVGVPLVAEATCAVSVALVPKLVVVLLTLNVVVVAAFVTVTVPVVA